MRIRSSRAVSYLLWNIIFFLFLGLCLILATCIVGDVEEGERESFSEEEDKEA